MIIFKVGVISPERRLEVNSITRVILRPFNYVSFNGIMIN